MLRWVPLLIAASLRISVRLDGRRAWAASPKLGTSVEVAACSACRDVAVAAGDFAVAAPDFAAVAPDFAMVVRYGRLEVRNHEVEVQNQRPGVRDQLGIGSSRSGRPPSMNRQAPGRVASAIR